MAKTLKGGLRMKLGENYALRVEFEKQTKLGGKKLHATIFIRDRRVTLKGHIPLSCSTSRMPESLVVLPCN